MHDDSHIQQFVWEVTEDVFGQVGEINVMRTRVKFFSYTD